MRAYVGLTDWDWYEFLRTRQPLDEVNFWRPSNTRGVSLALGTPFLFKLHHGRGGAVVGFGHYAGFSAPPMTAAWDAFTVRNGAGSFADFHQMLARIRETHGHPSDPAGTFRIGCLMLSQPVFFERRDWVDPPQDWPRTGLMGGKSIDVSGGEGARVWNDCLARVPSDRRVYAAPERLHEPAPERYGQPALVRPRLGQGTFKILVLDAYSGACAVTGEHSLPVLEAAHIRPYSEEGPHELGNGLLLRTDVHKLFDKGYVTISPNELRFVVSSRLRADFGNGRSYDHYHGKVIHMPAKREARPAREFLDWHASTVFKG